MPTPRSVDDAAAEGWARTLARGEPVIISQRRGPAALMSVGALVLLIIEFGLLAGVAGSSSLALSWRAPDLVLVTLVTAVIFLPFPAQRMITAGPRLVVSVEGLRYGRFRAAWRDLGTIRVANGQNVEIGALGRSGFPLDNAAVSALMRRCLRARGSWLSAWLDANAHELAQWLEQERRARR